MYTRVLLATDGSRESGVALREGALLAAAFKAAVFLLVIEQSAAGVWVAEGISPIPLRHDSAPNLMAAGIERLKRMGCAASGAVLTGDPALVIGKVAKDFRPDLIVVGHRRQNLLERWWSGPSGTYIVDNVPCSVLIARNVVPDEAIEAALARGDAAAAAASASGA